MRSAVGGCVEKSFPNPPPRTAASGFTMNMCASAGETERGGGTCFDVASSLRSALARASGSCDRKAPDSSA